MGLFGDKQKPAETPAENAELTFSEEYRDELRARGRDYFQTAIEDGSKLFKQDLRATIEHVNTEMRQHIVRQLDVTLGDIRTQLTKQIDEQFIEFDNAIKRARTEAIDSLEQRARELEEKSAHLGTQLEDNVRRQMDTFTKVVESQESKLQESLNQQSDLVGKAYEDNKRKIEAASEVQAVSMQALSSSVQALQQQHDELGKMIERNVENQEAMILELFENNLAQVVEHYLMKSLGETADVKAQLPSIMASLEENKQDMMDDMRLWPKSGILTIKNGVCQLV